MDYRIPLFDLNFDEREEQAVLETLRSRWISTGPRTEALEKAFAAKLGARHAVALTNCTVALHLALQIVGVRPEDEVIAPSLTFVATVNAIRYVGAVPVFCDIRSEDHLNLDAGLLERLITPRTRAIMVMHYGGFPCDMEKVLRVAQKHGLQVVEDACHGPLSEYGGQKLGTLGDIGCFSFFSNKNISTGEGGMLITQNESYAAKAKLLRSHGMTSLSYERARGHSTSYDVVELGYNYRIDDMRAALGLVQLDKLAADLVKRRKLRIQYIDRLKDVPQIVIPFKDHTDSVSNYIFPVVLRQGGADWRDEVRQQLARAGIQTSVHYPAVHRFSIYRPYRALLPKTEFVTDHEITLPLYGNLSEEAVDTICDELIRVVSKGR